MSPKSELIAKHSEISLLISDELSATGTRNLLRPEATSCAASAVATRFMLSRYAVKKVSVRGSLSMLCNCTLKCKQQSALIFYEDETIPQYQLAELGQQPRKKWVSADPLPVSERLSGGLSSHFGQPGESMSLLLHTAGGQVGL